MTLLGPPRFEGPQGRAEIPVRKGAALFWYLAAHPDSTFARAHLASLLWPDSGGDAARAVFNKTMGRLRASLPIWPIAATATAVGWDRTAGVWLDVGEFFRLCESPERATAMAAADLWGGPFLDGVQVARAEPFEEWLGRERTAWELCVLDLLGRIAQAGQRADDPVMVLRCARKALMIDPVQERFHRYAMAALASLGDRAAALLQYRELAALLMQELGVGPDAETTALRAHIIQHVRAPGMRLARSPARSRVPLVGRAHDLRRLRDLLRGGAEGRHRVILLTGEAGIGKTRLFEEWQRGGADPFETVAIGRCHAETTDLPYAPLVAALSTLDLTDLPLAPAWRTEVCRLLPDQGATWHVPAPAALPLAEERRRLLEGLVHLCSALPGPTLLALEDIHWADADTWLFLAYVARHPQCQGVVLLVTARWPEIPRERLPSLITLLHVGDLHHMALQAVSAADIGALVKSLVRSDDPLLAQRVHAVTGGNPLYAVEVLRALAQPDRPAGGWDGRIPLPQSIRQAVHARLGCLPQAAQDLLGAASIFPSAVTLRVLQHVAGQAETEALTSLQALVDGGFLQEARRGGTGIRFGHALVQAAVREGLTAARREALHRHALAALRSGLEPGTAPVDMSLVEDMLHHAQAGGLAQQGVEIGLQCFGRALAQGSATAAAAVLRTMVPLVESLPRTPAQLKLATGLYLLLVRMHFYEGPARVRAWLAAAGQGVLQMDDMAVRARFAVVDASMLVMEGALVEGVAAAQTALAWANELQLAGVGYFANIAASVGLALQGRWEQAEAHLDACATQEQAWRAPSPGRAAVPTIALDDNALYALVLPTVGMSRISEGHRALIAAFRGNWSAVLRHVDRALSAITHHDDVVSECLARLYLGPALAHTGRLDDALSEQQRTRLLCEEQGLVALLPRVLLGLAEVRRLRGELSAAEEAAGRAQALGDEMGLRFDTALAQKSFGMIAQAAGRGHQARSCLDQARRSFLEIGAQYEAQVCGALHETIS